MDSRSRNRFNRNRDRDRGIQNSDIPKASGASQSAISVLVTDPTAGQLGRVPGSNGMIVYPTTLPVPVPARDDSALLLPAATRITNPDQISFSDVIGMEDIKALVHIGYINRLKSKRLYVKSDMPPAILMYGPPGNGKTYVTRAIIGELNKGACTESTIGFHATGANISSRFHGETEKNISILWRAAQAEAERLAVTDPAASAVIFLDEVEAIGGRRGQSDVRDDSSTSALLQMMDGVVRYPRVRVIAATNLPWALDSALVSRFKIKLFVDLPPDAMREKFLVEQLRPFFEQPQDVERIRPDIQRVVRMTGPSLNGASDQIPNTGLPALTIHNWHTSKLRVPSAEAMSRHGYSMRDMISLIDRLMMNMATVKYVTESVRDGQCTFIKLDPATLATVLAGATGAATTTFTREQLASITSKNICPDGSFQELQYSTEFMQAHFIHVAEATLQQVPSTIRHDEYMNLIAYYQTGHEPQKK